MTLLGMSHCYRRKVIVLYLLTLMIQKLMLIHISIDFDFFYIYLQKGILKRRNKMKFIFEVQFPLYDLITVKIFRVASLSNYIIPQSSYLLLKA